MKIIFVRFGGRCCLDTIRYLEVYCLEEDLGEEYRKQLREWMRDDVSTEDKLGEGKTVTWKWTWRVLINISEQRKGRSM